jgi:hypothetical protein
LQEGFGLTHAGNSLCVSDLEHELITEYEALREREAMLADVARRSLVTAICAQDAALGHHDAWLDASLDAILSDDTLQPA